MSKSALSWGVVAAGIVLGISFLALVAPVMLYTSGLNDGPWERYAVGALMFSTLPASILAIYQRFLAGIWLTLVGGFATAIMSWNAHLLMASHSANADYGEVLGDASIAALVGAIGIFFVITTALNWPAIDTGAVRPD